MQMNIRFELAPKQRPKLADAIGDALHTIPLYQKAPTLSYKIGECTLEKDGTLRIPDSVDNETINRLLNHLQDVGFTGQMEETDERLIVTVPRDTFTDAALENLKKLVENKEELLGKAFETENLEINITDDTISFPWFPYTIEPDEVTAYTEFTSKLCEMARTVKRVSGKVTETDNDKYAFRCILLRLGFIGTEYKITRKILLKNLTGNSAFRYGN